MAVPLANKSPMRPLRIFCGFLFLTFLFYLALTGFVDAQPGVAQSMLNLGQKITSRPLLPYLDYYLDESGSMDIEEAAQAEHAGEYRPLEPEKLPRSMGVTWLRFVLAPLPADMRQGPLLLDLGQGVPGTPILYVPKQNNLSGAREWSEMTPSSRQILLMPEAQSQALSCYIRLDGLPGLWFAPMLRDPENAASNWSGLVYPAGILALGLVLLLCLLRGLAESGEWRFWTALYLAFAIAQALLGMPASAATHLGLAYAASVLAPGIALMLFPHLARHLLATRSHSRALDIQLLLLSLPGVALALLPLLPDWDWLTRWLPLWPMAMLIFVPTALGAWLSGLGGARRFLLGCLIPPLFVAVGVFGLDFGLPADVLAALPVWGIALSALIIVAMRAPLYQDEAEDGADAAEDAPLSKGPQTPGSDGIISLDHPLDDPNLRLLSPDSGALGLEPDARGHAGQREQNTEGAVFCASQLKELAKARAEAETRESGLREPLETLLREGTALEQCSLPPAVRQYAEKMLSAARGMADLLSGHSSGEPAENPSPCAEDSEKKALAASEQTGAFNLQQLLRDAHDYVSPQAEYAGIGLSWYMPPHLGQIYEGDATALSAVLRLLLESAVRATSKGAVHLSARRVPESVNPGHILFSVSDSGDGIPPKERSGLALVKAWELAASQGGYVGLEYGPHGTNIAFSLHFKALEKDDEIPALSSEPHLIIIAEDGRIRQELARMLNDLPIRISECASVAEALRRQAADPAILLIAQGRFARPSAADLAREFCRMAKAGGLPVCKLLAVTEDDSQWKLLAESGFTHALLEPVEGEALRQTVCDVMDMASQMACEARQSCQEISEGAPDKRATESGEEAPIASLSLESLGDAADAPASMPQDFAAEIKSAASEKPAAAKFSEPESAAQDMPQAAEAAEALADKAAFSSPAREGASDSSDSPYSKNEAEIPVQTEPLGFEREKETLQQGGFLDSFSLQSPGLADTKAQQPHEQSSSQAFSAQRVDSYISPALSVPGEWVGEPMPLGAQLSGHGSAFQESAPAENRNNNYAPEPKSPSATLGGAAGKSNLAYQSPSMPVPGEWVGEPMPILRNEPKPEAPEPQGVEPQEQNTLARENESLLGPADSLMDFILGAEPHQAAEDAAKPEKLAPQSLSASAEAPPTVKNFVASSAALVFTAISSALSPRRQANAEQGSPEQADPALIRTEEEKSAFATLRESSGDGSSVSRPARQAQERIQSEPRYDPSADSALMQFVERLDKAMQAAHSANATGNCPGVAQAAAGIAAESEAFGFRVLSRMAHCVERAAQAGDFVALKDLLPELASAVERNRIALTQEK